MAAIKEITFSSSKQFELINITRAVEEFIQASQISEGICCLFVPHATAGLIVNEDEPGVKKDILKSILALAPEKESYLHNKIDNNARAHVMASIIGPDLNFPINNSQLLRGIWQEIFFVELDGPRPSRKVILKIIEG